jgi:hypothetical protein
MARRPVAETTCTTNGWTNTEQQRYNLTTKDKKIVFLKGRAVKNRYCRIYYVVLALI